MIEHIMPLPVEHIPAFPVHPSLQGRVLAFDIETTGIWEGVLVVAGVAWVSGPQTIHVQQWVADSPDDQSNVARAVWACLHEQAGTVVSYNGRSFDVPWVTQRLGLPGPHRLGPGHVVLYEIAASWKGRGAWRRASLTSVAGSVGVPREDATEGREVAGLCERLLAGERSVLETILAHNRDDLLDTLHITPLLLGAAAPKWLPPYGRKRWGWALSRAGIMVDPGAAPTNDQRRHIREMVEKVGVAVPNPATKADASKEIDRLHVLVRAYDRLQEARELGQRLIPPEPVVIERAGTYEEAEAEYQRIRQIWNSGTRRHPSTDQLGYLQDLAGQCGVPAPEVGTMAEASTAIDRLRVLAAIAEMADRLFLPPGAVVAAASPSREAALGVYWYLKIVDSRSTLAGIDRAARMHAQPELLDGSLDGVPPEIVEQIENVLTMRPDWARAWDDPGALNFGLYLVAPHESVARQVTQDFPFRCDGRYLFKGWRWVLRDAFATADPTLVGPVREKRPSPWRLQETVKRAEQSFQLPADEVRVLMLTERNLAALEALFDHVGAHRPGELTLAEVQEVTVLASSWNALEAMQEYWQYLGPRVTMQGLRRAARCTGSPDAVHGVVTAAPAEWVQLLSALEGAGPIKLPGRPRGEVALIKQLEEERLIATIRRERLVYPGWRGILEERFPPA